MKRSLQLAVVFLLMNVGRGYSAPCTHAANDNCANAVALVVNGAAVASSTCGTLETGELTDCAPAGTNQSVWYSFVATDTTMAVTVVSTGVCFVSSAVWPASSGCPATTGCHALSCQSGDNGPATTVHELNNLTVGATYEVQIMYASGNGCGQDGTFTIKVSTTIPNSPSNPLALSTCEAPSGPGCVFNYNPATANQVTANCTDEYQIIGNDTDVNNVVKACFTFTGQYSTDISVSNIFYGTCSQLTGTLDWFDWQIFDTTCNSIACGQYPNVSYSGIQCGTDYVVCYTWEIPDCQETAFWPYVVAIPPTFTATSTPGGSTTGSSLAVSICQGASVSLTAHATAYVSYVWSPAAGLSSTTGSPVTASPDTTTTYTLTGYDAGGCSQSKTIVITVKPAPSATITPSPDSLTCTTTSLTLTAGGGGTYLWSTGATTPSVTATTPISYTVTVTGANACSATANTVVGQDITPPAAAVNPPTNALSCGISSVTLTASGGVSYVWGTGATTSSITVTGVNTYTVTATGANGCTATASGVVTSGSSGISATATSTNASCAPNGTATAIPSGGSVYTYLWNTNDTTQTISNLGPGNYTVTVTGGSCTATASVSVILSSSGISASATSTATGCTPSGTATVTPSGGASYTYLWSNNGTTPTISNLPSGTYMVTVTSGGCTATASAAVASGGGAITLTPGSTAATCTSASGSATVTASTGTGPFTYLWNTNDTSQNLNNIAAGTYTVTVNGAGGCSATASINVATTGGLTVSATPVATTCGNNNGSASASITSGAGPYTYSWSNSTTGQGISNVSAGSYTVTVTGSGGCTGTATVNVAISNPISAAITATNTSCGLNNGVAMANPSGGTGGYTYLWSDNTTAQSDSDLASGNYSVTVTGGGCTATASATINPSGAGSVSITSNKTIMCSGDTAIVCAPAGYAAYLWNTGETTQCISTTFSGTYYLTATDNGNCTATSNQITVSNYSPSPVTVSINGDTLTSYGQTAYQWYFNGQPIVGANNSTYVATQSGDYKVEITDNHGCQYSSSVVTVKVAGINSVDPASEIKVYPNPLSSGSWHVDISETLIGSACEVFDADGRIVYKGELKSTRSEISLAVAQGVYVMQIHTADWNYNLKLIKLY